MSIEQIAYNIKFLREINDWTQQKLADELKISRSMITKWENNQLIPDIQSLIKLSDLFGVSLDYLVGNEIHRKDIIKEFKRIYRSHSVDFDDEAIYLVEYIMKHPEFKEQVYRLSDLSLKKQSSIHKLLRHVIDEYEKI